MHESLQKNMQSNVGIIRTKKEMEEGIKNIEELKLEYKTVKANGSSQFNPGWHEALGMRNLLITAEAVAKAAYMREESRGAHTRDDFPEERQDWEKYNIILKKGSDGKMKIKKDLRKDPDPELMRIAFSKTDSDVIAKKKGTFQERPKRQPGESKKSKKVRTIKYLLILIH